MHIHVNTSCQLNTVTNHIKLVITYITVLSSTNFGVLITEKRFYVSRETIIWVRVNFIYYTGWHFIYYIWDIESNRHFSSVSDWYCLTGNITESCDIRMYNWLSGEDIREVLRQFVVTISKIEFQSSNLHDSIDL